MSFEADLLSAVPADARALVADLLAEPSIGHDDLLDAVADYLDEISLAAARDGFVDAKLGETVAEVCLELLADLGSGTSDKDNRLVQVAVRYFVVEDDAPPRGGGAPPPHARVLNAILRLLGREELLIEVP